MLEEMQKWFGEAISAAHFQTDANIYIKPSETLNPNERLALYHEQYWLRLLRVLEKHFPTLVRELGKERFDEEIAIPFLVAHPPHHWALSRLGARLPSWLEGERALIAAVDWAAEVAFWEEERSKPDFTALSEEEMRTIPLTLQPYISLFALEADYFSFREGKPLVERPGFFVTYRAPQGFAAWKEITKPAYLLLKAFEKGCSIEEGCAQIEGSSEIAFWFKEWSLCSFFALV